MTIRHHLDDATLLAFAAGTLPPELSIVAAAHLEGCARCRRELKLLESLGAAMLDDLAPSELTRDPPVPEAPGADANGPHQGPRHGATPPAPGMPRTLTGLLPASFDRIPWKRLARGLWRYDLVITGVTRGRGGAVYLLKGSPGVAIPEHSHAGGELTLVLEGAFSDSTGRYGVGDVADLDDHNAHTPVACPEAGCICIVGEEGPPAFRSLGARVIQSLRSS